MTEPIQNLLKRDRWKLGLVTLLALVLRIAYLHWGLPSETHDLNSYHPDENGVLIALGNMNPSELDFDTKTYYWGTAYFYMVATVFKSLQIAGWLELVSDRSFYLAHLEKMDRLYLAGRALSLTLAILSIPLIYYVGARWRGREVGVWCALLLAALPVHAMRSALMLPDGPGVFFLLCSLCCFIGAQDRKRFALAGLCFGFACATKYHFALTLPFFLYTLVQRRQFRANAIWCGLGSVLGFVLGCPYLVLNIGNVLTWIRDIAAYMVAGHGAVMGEYHSGILCAVNMFVFAGAAFFAAAIALTGEVFARRKKEQLGLVLPFALFGLLLSLSRTRLSYYLLPSVPFAVLLVADWIRGHGRRGVVVGWIVAGLSFLQAWSFAEIALRKDTRTQLSEYLVQHIPAQTRIGVTHNKYFYTPPILMERETYFQVEVFGNNFRDYDLAKLQRLKPPNFVLSEFEWREPSVHPERAPERKAFADYVMNSGEYVLDVQISAAPSILGIELPRITPPWNERTLYPTMRLYRRKE